MAGIEGLHHVTAIAGEPQVNIDFYAGVLGFRLVKLTVNFDDPTTYHLYYGDGQGHPGTIMTFFPWPGASRGTRPLGPKNGLDSGDQMDFEPTWHTHLQQPLKVACFWRKANLAQRGCPMNVRRTAIPGRNRSENSSDGSRPIPSQSNRIGRGSIYNFLVCGRYRLSRRKQIVEEHFDTISDAGLDASV